MRTRVCRWTFFLCKVSCLTTVILTGGVSGWGVWTNIDSFRNNLSWKIYGPKFCHHFNEVTAIIKLRDNKFHNISNWFTNNLHLNLHITSRSITDVQGRRNIFGKRKSVHACKSVSESWSNSKNNDNRERL